MSFRLKLLLSAAFTASLAGCAPLECADASAGAVSYKAGHNA